MNTEHNRFTLRELGLDGLHHIYHEHLSHAFPRMERKPLSAMEKLMAAGRYEALGLYDGEELAAYALLWDDPEGGYVLLDYLAVCRDKPRGHGYGTAALRLLLDRCRDPRSLGRRRRRTLCAAGVWRFTAGAGFGTWAIPPASLASPTPCWSAASPTRRGPRRPTGGCTTTNFRLGSTGGSSTSPRRTEPEAETV